MRAARRAGLFGGERIPCENGVVRAGNGGLAQRPDPPSKDTLKLTVPLLALCLATCLAGCQAVFHVNDEDAQGIVDKRVLGMSVGDFFTRYGAPSSRAEAKDGTLMFNWGSKSPNMAPGPRGPEESLCWLRLSTDRKGIIVSAPITRDGKGQKHLSVCADLFEPA